VGSAQLSGVSRLFGGEGRGLALRVDGFGQVVQPFLLKSDPPSWNQGDGGKSHGKGLLGLISEGKVEKDCIRSIIIVPGEEDFFCSGEGDLQVDLFTPLPFRNLKTDYIFLD
jgi:hypothetical protein